MFTLSWLDECIQVNAIFILLRCMLAGVAAVAWVTMTAAAAWAEGGVEEMASWAGAAWEAGAAWAAATWARASWATEGGEVGAAAEWAVEEADMGELSLRQMAC